jgi:hypothetical protein
MLWDALTSVALVKWTVSIQIMAGWPFFVYPDPLAVPKRLAGSRLHPVRSRCDGSDEQVKSELACVLGRWSWRTTEWCSKYDLQEALHECRLSGGKGYLQMTIDELLNEIFIESGLIEHQRDQYDESSKPEPLGMDTMSEADKSLWFDE